MNSGMGCSMRVLFLTRSTLYKVYGGDTVQIEGTAKYLRRLGVEVDIRLSDEHIDYTPYDLIHYFNITRPADLLPHIARSRKPYVVSTIFVDYSDYEKAHRGGTVSVLGRALGPDRLEYVKALARWMRNGEAVRSRSYLLRGHRNSIRRIAREALFLLPNSESENRRFRTKYGGENPYRVISNAIDPEVFNFEPDEVEMPRDPKQVICVSRIEGKKNQLNLIRALNNTEFRLTLIGKPAPNHMGYYEQCRRIAAPNVHFADFVSIGELRSWYLNAKVHVLPSWNETCGLSTMEAAYAGCNVVITDKGDTVDYFGTHAWYCDPGDPQSIYRTIAEAAKAPVTADLRRKISSEYTWDETARQTLLAYEEALVAAGIRRKGTMSECSGMQGRFR
jgi:glycosyltransferase involved in cell wall biosynthesis